MKVKLMGNQTLNYKGKNYREGDTFEIKKEYFDRFQSLLQEVEESEPEMEKTEVSPEDPSSEEAPEIAKDLSLEESEEQLTLDDLNLTELKELLDNRGIKYSSNAKKKELQELLK